MLTRPLLHGKYFSKGVDWQALENLSNWKSDILSRDFKAGNCNVFLRCPPEQIKKRAWLECGLSGGFVRGYFVSAFVHKDLQRNHAHFRWYRSSAESDHVVILNHGTSGGCFLEEWKIVRPLVQQGLSVVLLWTPNFGPRRAELTSDWSDTIAGVAESVVQLVYDNILLSNWLRKQGYRQVTGVGLSLGGVATGLAAEFQDCFDNIVVAMVGNHLADFWCKPGRLASVVNWRALYAAGVVSEKDLRELLELFSLGSTSVHRDTSGQNHTINSRYRIFAASNDRLLPAASVNALRDHWQCEIQWFLGGHLEWILHSDKITDAIVKSESSALLSKMTA